MIKYINGSLFDAPKGSVLVHAVNGQGVWGSGIAVDFKRLFPESFRWYQYWCKDPMPYMGRPNATIYLVENGYRVGCLLTSIGYGDDKDPPAMILRRTKAAVSDILSLTDSPICSNKFNSGLFGVPWEDTEKVLESVIGEREWTVYDPR